MMPKDYMEKTIWTLGEYLLYILFTLGWLIAKNKNKYTKKVRSVRVLIADSMLLAKGKRTSAPSYLERPVQNLVLLVKNERNQEIPIKKAQKLIRLLQRITNRQVQEMFEWSVWPL